MMDLATIRALSEEAGAEAERRGRNPAVIDGTDLAAAKAGDLSVLQIPNIGTYLPKNFERVSLEAEDGKKGVYMGDNDGFGAYLVDKSGFAADYEPALTLAQFVERLVPGYGYAVVEEGQFQVKVGKFKWTGDLDGRR